MDRTASIILRFIDEASAPLRAAASGVAGAFEGMNGAVDKTAKATTGVFGGMVQTFKDNLTNLADHAKWASFMFGTQLVNAISDVVSMASKFERFGIAAQFMTGSAQEADKFAASVRNISKETMFNVDQIAELEARMVGITGKVDLSDRALRAFADAVAATGGSYTQLEGATRAWTQTLSKSKASSEELNRQFANANIPVLRKLAEAVYNDADHPLRKYIETATVTGGANKTMTKSFQTATENLPILEKELRKNEEALKEYNSTNKKTTSGLLSKELAVEKSRIALDKAKNSISAYGEAQSKTNTVVKQFSVEEILAQFQRIGDLNIPGSIMADSVVDALEKAYGGANIQLIKTFDGQMSLLQDTLKLTVLSFMGLDDSFRPIEGGIFSMLKNALTPLVEWLTKNQVAIQEFGKAIGSNMPVLLGMGAFIIGVLSPALLGLIAPLAVLGSMYMGLGLAIGLVADTLIDFGGKTDKQKELEKQLKDATDQLNPSINNLRGYSKDTTAEIKKLNEQLAEEKRLAEESYDPMRLIGGTFEGLTEQVRGLLTVLFPTNEAVKTFKIGMGDLVQFLVFPIYLIATFANSLSDIILHLELATLSVFKFMAALEGNTGMVDAITSQTDAIGVKLFELNSKWQETEDNYWNMGGSIKTSALDMQMGLTNTWGATSSYLTGQSTATKGSIINDWIELANTTETETTRACTASTTNFNKAWTDATTATNGLKKDVSSNYQSTYQNVDQYATWAKKTTYENFEGAKTSATTQSKEMMVNYKNNIDWSKPNVESSMGAVMTSIDTKMKNQAEASRGHGKSIVDNFIDGIKNAAKALGSLGNTILGKMGFGDLKFAHGGVVPGPIGAPVPIVAHGGERITPVNGVDSNGGGGAINLNFYGGVVVDSEERLDELANRINQVLGRQNELARYGVGV